MTKSHIPAENAPPRVEIPTRPTAPFEPIQRQKRGRPIGAKDANPRKKKVANDNLSLLAPPEEATPEESSPGRYKAAASCNNNPGNTERPSPTVQGNDEDLVDVDIEVAFNYVNTGDRYDRKVTVVDNIFASAVALAVSRDILDPEPKSILECQKRSDWIKWKEAIQAELDSLNKRNVFGPVVQTPNNVIPVGYKWVFVRKRNDKNEVVRYKARLVAQGFFAETRHRF